MFRFSWFALLAASALVACAPEVDLERSHHELTTANGKSLNGKSLNGKSLNGSPLGSTLLWASLEGVKLDGTTLTSTTVEGSMFHGINGKSGTFQGTDFDGAEFQAMSDEGNPVRLRVTEVYPPPDGDDVWRYDVQYRDTDNGWYPICQDDAGLIAAIPVNGWWDPAHGGKVEEAGKFTFACPRVGAIGKCVDIGYRPWASAGGVSLDEHHQGCVRLIRADYCGDGNSYTDEGTVVNLYDDVGVQHDTEDWAIEAEWDAAGARCVSPADRSLWNLPCYDERASVACGSESNFASGTLLMSETDSEVL